MAAIRKNILTDSAVRDKYVQGVLALKNDFLRPGIWPNTYDIFVIWHHQAMMTMTPSTQNSRNAAHSGPAFLPWHRYMLILLENHLQRVLGDPNFGLPYWDWAADGARPPAGQLSSAIWAQNCMGTNQGQVSTGALGAFRVNLESNFQAEIVQVPPRRIRRQAGLSVSTLPTPADVTAATSPNAYDQANWNQSSPGSFRNLLEGWPNGPQMHNRVHVWIGGDMGPATSPNDPVFYLNHCNVDRIWDSWQKMPGKGPYAPATGSADLTRHRLNDRLFVVTTRQVFDPLFRGNVTNAQLQDVSQIYTYQ
jgi:tyrosinase